MQGILEAIQNTPIPTLLIVVGLILNHNTSQELDRNLGNDSPDYDIVTYSKDTSEKDCIKYCNKDKRCVAVVTSPQGKCWLKDRLNYPFTQNPNRTVIKVKPS